MKIFLQLASCFLALHAATLVDPNQMEWQEFKAKFGKTYKTQEEEDFRMKIFMDRRATIAEHNAKYERGEVTYMMGINKFSDLTVEEFLARYTGLKTQATSNTRTEAHITNFQDNLTVPDYVNWVKKGAVTPVKDQGDCGSCYAFSATGAMEGQHFLLNGTLVSLSEQNILDCTHNFSNNECFGGLVDNVYDYVIDNGGIDTEASYPYEAEPDTCRFTRENIGATFSSFRDLPTGDENALKKAVATIGPISVTVDASNFLLYKSGIFSDPTCSESAVNHAVLVVGYGAVRRTHQQYWLVKNSWGAEWGEHGYIRMARNADNMCGIATAPSYPVV